MSRTSIILIALMFACGPLTNSSDAGPSPDFACGAEATSVCQKYDACGNDAGASTRYGSFETCVARTKANCLLTLTVAGTGRTADQVLACAPARSAESCADFLDNNPPAPCRAAAGAFALGAPCGTSSQCQSAFCAIARDAGCGTCAAAPSAGADCTVTASCPPGQVCANQVDSGVYLCKTPGVLASGCDKNTPCATGFGCVSAKVDGGVEGVCQPLGESLGASCDATSRTAPGCDATVGLFCDSVSKVCEAVTTTSAGGDCGTLDAGTRRVVCGNASVCENTVRGAGTCVARAADDSACDTELGPSCTPPARCVTAAGSSAGTCRLPSSCQ